MNLSGPLATLDGLRVLWEKSGWRWNMADSFPPASLPPLLLSFLYFFPKSRNVVEILLWSKPVSLWCFTRDINGESFPLILECTAGFAVTSFPSPSHFPIASFVYTYIKMSKCGKAEEKRLPPYITIESWFPHNFTEYIRWIETFASTLSC